MVLPPVFQDTGDIGVIHGYPIVPLGQGHGRGLQDILAIGHFGNTDAAILVIVDF